MKVVEKYKTKRDINTGRCNECKQLIILPKDTIIEFPWIGYQPNFHSSTPYSFMPKYPRNEKRELLDFFYINLEELKNSHKEHDHLCIVWDKFIQKHSNWFIPVGKEVEIE